MRHIVLSLVMFFYGLAAYGKENPVLSQYKVLRPSPEALRRISQKWEIVGRDGVIYDVILPAKDVPQLISMPKMGLKLVEADISAVFRDPDLRATGYFAGYRGFDEVMTHMKELAAKYPNIVQLSQYGQSSEGLPLMVLKVSDEVATDETEPKIMLDAATHGDEVITVEVLLGILDEIVTGYGKDKRMTDLVNNSQLFVIPVVNPDGFSKRQRYADGVDPNREYPWPENENRESIGIISDLIGLTSQHRFAGSLTFHAAGQIIMYPWAFSMQSIEQDSLKTEYEQLTEQMAQLNRYRTGQIAQILYVAQGSSSDYYLWKNNTLAVAVELATTKAPHTSKISEITNQSKEMTYAFIEHFLTATSP
jgi:murein tripeptide amidase MpaA